MAESTKNIGRVIMLYKGEYSPKTTYTKLDVVYQDSTKSSYISLQDNNIGKEPKDNPTFWGVISRAKYEVNDQDIKDAVTNVIATSDFKVGNMDIVTDNPSIDFHFNNSEEPTSSIKEFSSGILQVPGSLAVLGDLLANATSARALDHPIQINGQDIQTVVNNNSKLTADVQVNTLKASTDLSNLSVYPSLNATYGLSGKYVASPNDATSYTAILQVSSYPDASHVRLTLIDTGALGSIYTRTYTSGNWSTWQKIVIDSDTIAKASTAGKLAKAVSINGTAFDGSSDIAVNAANDSSLVHKSGDETVSGFKKFSGNIATTSDNSMINGGGNNGDIALVKKNGDQGFLAVGTDNSALRIKISSNSAISPSDTFTDMFTVDKSGVVKAGTQQDLVPLDKNVVHKSSDESIAGDKTFTDTVTAGGTQLTDSGWKTLTSSIGGTVRYRKLNGIVFVQGYDLPALNNENKAIATLPAGCIPSSTVWQPWYAGGNVGNMTINESGVLKKVSSNNTGNDNVKMSPFFSYPADN